jgi:hypothetical protein
MSQFGEHVQLAMDNTNKRPIMRLPMNLGSNERWKNFRVNTWSRNFIDHILIHEQVGISKEGAVDDVNATFEKAKTISKRITRPLAFVENEQWSVVDMKKEFHARFATII